MFSNPSNFSGTSTILINPIEQVEAPMGLLKLREDYMAGKMSYDQYYETYLNIQQNIDRDNYNKKMEQINEANRIYGGGQNRPPTELAALMMANDGIDMQPEFMSNIIRNQEDIGERLYKVYLDNADSGRFTDVEYQRYEPASIFKQIKNDRNKIKAELKDSVNAVHEQQIKAKKTRQKKLVVVNEPQLQVEEQINRQANQQLARYKKLENPDDENADKLEELVENAEERFLKENPIEARKRRLAKALYDEIEDRAIENEISGRMIGQIPFEPPIPGQPIPPNSNLADINRLIEDQYNFGDLPAIQGQGKKKTNIKEGWSKIKKVKPIKF